MSKYINADRLISMLESKADMTLGTQKKVFHYVVKMVNVLPAADVVDVIRCKDCNHYIAGFCTRDIDGRTNMFRMSENDYCSYGGKSYIRQ